MSATVASLLATLSPTVTFEFDEAAVNFVSTGSNVGELQPIDTSQFWFKAPGVIRDGNDEFAQWFTSISNGENSLQGNATLNDAWDATSHSTGCYAIWGLVWEDVGASDQLNLWTHRMGSAAEEVNMYVDPNGAVHFEMTDGATDSYHVRTPNNTIVLGEPFLILVYQREDATGIHIKFNNVDQTLTDVARTGTGTSDDAWFDDIFGTSACSVTNLNNENNLLVGSGAAWICQRPTYWRNDVPTDLEMTDLYNTSDLNGTAENLFHFIMDKCSNDVQHLYLTSQVNDDTTPNTASHEVIGGGIVTNTIQGSGNVLLRSTGFGGSSQYGVVDTNIVSGVFDYELFAPASDGSSPKLTSNTSQWDGTEGTGSFNINILWDDQLTVGLRRTLVTASNVNAGATVGIKLDIEAVAGPQYNLILDLSDGTNEYVLTFNDAIAADEYASFLVVQDGVAVKVYKNGVELTADSTSGSLSAGAWFDSFSGVSNFLTVMGGAEFGNDLDGNQLGIFFWTPYVFTDTDASELWDAMNGTFAATPFSSKTIRRAGYRRLFSDELP